MKPPEFVTATQAELDGLLALAKTSFPLPQYQLLEGVLDTFVYVMQALQNAKTSLRRFRHMLFGTSTETKRKVLKKILENAVDPAVDPAAHLAPAAAVPNPAADPAAAGPPAAGHLGTVPQPPPLAGHGRHGAKAYIDSPVVELTLSDLRSGDPCPKCLNGKVYASPPRIMVKLVGTPPLTATVYQVERLRCRLCDAVFTAPLPDHLPLGKYDHSCASMIALLRYGSGVPFYRLEGLQASLNVPLPDATQWDIVTAAIAGPRAARDELIRQAAQAPLLHNDDTPARILDLMKARAEAEAAGQKVVAKAINTSGIVADLQGKKVVLFFTGHAHAGQNLTRVLAHRAAGLTPPIQMSDALACNFTGEFETIVSKCLTHGRRKVVDVLEQFPEPGRYLIEVLAEIYAHEAHCRDEKMSPDARLVYHQTHSDPPLQVLHGWMNEQLDQHRVEPNSGLGRALRYLIKHWSGLTLFLRQAGAPLDNNICERALKRSILHRKNSMFYKTLYGAEVGDIYMSLIHTCQLCGVNAFAYLQALHARAAAVLANPAQWLPWNFREQI